MKHFFATVLFAAGFLSASYALGQIYNDQYDGVITPFENVITDHNTTFSNVKNAGDDENQFSQKERYSNMTEPVDSANIRHFNESVTHL